MAQQKLWGLCKQSMTRDKKLQPGQKGKKDKQQQSMVKDAMGLLPQLSSPDWHTKESDEHSCRKKKNRGE